MMGAAGGGERAVVGGGQIKPMLCSLAKPSAVRRRAFGGNIECLGEGEAERVSALQAGSLAPQFGARAHLRER